jgi:hypothetical protein
VGYVPLQNPTRDDYIEVAKKRYNPVSDRVDTIGSGLFGIGTTPQERIGLNEKLQEEIIEIKQSSQYNSPIPTGESSKKRKLGESPYSQQYSNKTSPIKLTPNIEYILNENQSNQHRLSIDLLSKYEESKQVIITDEESEMDSEIDHKITKSSRTFIFDRLEGDTDKLPSEALNEDRIFVGIDKGDVEFGKGSDKLIDYNSLEQYL